MSLYTFAHKFYEMDVGYSKSYVSMVDEDNIDVTISTNTLSNGDKVITMQIAEELVERENNYANYNGPTGLFKKGGTIEIKYDSSKIKEIKISSTEKEVELQGTSYVDKDKVISYSTKYEISYEYDESVINSFPAEHR